MANLKISALEIDGVEQEGPVEYRYDADDQDFSPGSTGLVSTKTGDAVREIQEATKVVSPPVFLYGVGNSINNGYLKCVGGAVSNNTGYPVDLDNASVVKISYIGESPSSADIVLYTHDGGGANLTELGRVSLGNVSASEDFDVSYSVTKNKAIAAYIDGSSNQCTVTVRVEGEL